MRFRFLHPPRVSHGLRKELSFTFFSIDGADVSIKNGHGVTHFAAYFRSSPPQRTTSPQAKASTYNNPVNTLEHAT